MQHCVIAALQSPTEARKSYVAIYLSNTLLDSVQPIQHIRALASYYAYFELFTHDRQDLHNTQTAALGSYDNRPIKPLRTTPPGHSPLSLVPYADRLGSGSRFVVG